MAGIAKRKRGACRRRGENDLASFRALPLLPRGSFATAHTYRHTHTYRDEPVFSPCFVSNRRLCVWPAHPLAAEKLANWRGVFPPRTPSCAQAAFSIFFHASRPPSPFTTHTHTQRQSWTSWSNKRSRQTRRKPTRQASPSRHDPLPKKEQQQQQQRQPQQQKEGPLPPPFPGGRAFPRTFLWPSLL